MKRENIENLIKTLKAYAKTLHLCPMPFLSLQVHSDAECIQVFTTQSVAVCRVAARYSTLVDKLNYTNLVAQADALPVMDSIIKATLALSVTYVKAAGRRIRSFASKKLHVSRSPA